MPSVRAWLAPLCAALLAAVFTAPAAARLLIEIDKASQSMTVSQDGERLHRWPVSSGTRAYATPSGLFRPFRMEKDHFSREWDDAPMPHSIFFTKQGHAIHGTTHIRAIGRPASHGCVRLEPENARVLFDLVRRVGMGNTRVVLQGETPETRAPAMARQPRNGERLEPRATRYGQRPGYIESPPDYPALGPGEYRNGNWMQFPDGRWVFVEERDARTLPPRPPTLWRRPPQ